MRIMWSYVSKYILEELHKNLDFEASEETRRESVLRYT